MSPAPLLPGGWLDGGWNQHGSARRKAIYQEGGARSQARSTASLKGGERWPELRCKLNSGYQKNERISVWEKLSAELEFRREMRVRCGMRNWSSNCKQSVRELLVPKIARKG